MPEVLLMIIKACSERNQEYMDNYIKQIDEMIKDYKKIGRNTNKYKYQYNTLVKLKTPKNCKQFLKERNEEKKKIKNR